MTEEPPPEEPGTEAPRQEELRTGGLDEEIVDGLPVLAEVRPVATPPPAGLPAVQTAAVAATGFVAGAATLALLHRHHTRRVLRAQRSVPRRAVDMLPVVGSRTFLVDVHLIAKPTD